MLQRFPLVGPLFRVGLSAHFAALRDTAITVALSTTPFWLGGYVLVLLSHSSKSWGLYITSIGQTLSRGELLLVGPSLLAPVVLLVWQTWPEHDRIQKGTLVILSGIIMLLSTVPFALQLAKVVPDQLYVVGLSKLSLGACIVVLYVHTVGDALGPGDIATSQTREEVALAEKLRVRRETVQDRQSRGDAE